MATTTPILNNSIHSFIPMFFVWEKPNKIFINEMLKQIIFIKNTFKHTCIICF